MNKNLMRTLRVTLLVSQISLFGQRGFAAEEERVPFLGHAAAVMTVDGVLIASDTSAFPYSVRIVGGDKSKLKFDDGQIFVGNKDYLFRNTVVWIKDLAMKERGDDRKVLQAHLEWEVADLNVQTQQKLSTKSEFVEINGRTWAYWIYDLSAFFKRMKKDKPDAFSGPEKKVQCYLTTIVGNYVVVFVTTTPGSPKDRLAKDALQRVAKTFVVYPKPLTPEQMSALGKEKQP